jgi:acyl-CoA synthetase (NDP forming)
VTAHLQRRGLYGRKELSPILAPRSIAVVGASERKGSFGGQVLRNLGTHSSASLMAVNPSATEVFGVPSVPTLSDLPAPVDAVAVAVRWDMAIDVVRDAARLGIPGAVVYSSGFAETGLPERAEAQQRLAAVASKGLRILGPNCFGLVNVRDGIQMQFVDSLGQSMKAGSIGVVAQSGALGAVLLQAQYRGVGFSYGVTPGNSCDIDVFDLMNFMIEDPDTNTIVAVFEGVEDGERLMEVGRRAAAVGKPVITHKMGRSELGSTVARSHTGMIAGADDVYAEALRASGFVTVDNFDAIIETAALFSKAGRPRGADGIGVMASSGGAAVMSADAAESVGVTLPPLSAPTEAAIRDLVPGFASVRNPADITAEALKNSEMYQQCIRLFTQDDRFDAVIVPLTIAGPDLSGPRTSAILEVGAERAGAPLCVVWLSEWMDGPGAAEIDADPDVTLFRSMYRAMLALRLWRQWGRDVQRGGVPPSGDFAADEAATQAARQAMRFAQDAVGVTDPGAPVALDEFEGKIVLRAAGIPTSDPVVISDPDDASLETLSYPVVAKVLAREITHKAQVGGVRLNLASAGDVRAAVAELRTSFAEHGSPSVLVETMAPSQMELFVGAKRDDTFGPVLLVGRGGTDVERNSDTLMLVGRPPRSSIAERLRDWDGPAGQAFRESTALREAVVDVCERVYRLLAAAPQIRELDVNPILVDGERLLAVDSYMTVQTGSPAHADQES